MGERLTAAVVDAVRLLANRRGRVTDWVFKAAFRLLAAKVPAETSASPVLPVQICWKSISLSSASRGITGPAIRLPSVMNMTQAARGCG